MRSLILARFSALVFLIASNAWAFAPAAKIVRREPGNVSYFSHRARHSHPSRIFSASDTGGILDSDNSDSSSNSDITPDLGNIAKYVVATSLQFGILAGALKLIDKLVFLPKPIVGFLFAFLSLRSRVASVLDNSRPNRDAQDGKATPSDVKRPSWTPPGIAFPFIWLSITGLRGVSSAMVYGQTDALFSAPLLSMVLHLCIGDTWNTITNMEKRLGVSAIGCVVVWMSVWNAIIRYYKVMPLAGKLLAPSGIWISIATILSYSIWRINTPIQPLWPVKGDGKSASFKWSNLGQLQPTSIAGKADTE